MIADGLYDEGTNWSPKGAHGWGPLHLAAACGDMKGLLLLLDQVKESEELAASAAAAGSRGGGKRAPSKLELEGKSGDRALHVALRNGQVLAVRELARAGCNVHARGKDGETAAHICAALDLGEELSWMIRNNGLDPTVLTDKGETIVHVAMRHCRISFLEWVIEQPFGTYALFSARSKAGDTCVHEAARSGHRLGLQWVMAYLDRQEKKLAEADALALMEPNSAGRDPGAVGRCEGHYMCANMVDEYKSKKLRERKSRRLAGKRLLDAARANNLKAAQNVVRKNMRHFNVLDFVNPKNGSNPTLEAAAAGSLEVLRFLLDYSGKRDLRNHKSGDSILHKAVQSRSLATVEYLLSKRFINTKELNAQGEWPVQVARRLELSEIAAAIDAHDAKPRWPPASPGAATLGPAAGIAVATADGEGATSLPQSPHHEANDKPKGQMQPTPASRKEQRRSELRVWLDAIDLGEWLEQLCEEGFDSLPRLENVEEQDLVEIGMKKGYRRSFLRAVEGLRLETAVRGPAGATGSGAAAGQGQVLSPTRPSTSSGSGSGASLGFNGQYSAVLARRDLREGEEIAFEGFTRGNKYVPGGVPRQFVLRRSGGVFECTCAEWKVEQAKVPREARTCAHLKELRGEEAETRRLDLRHKRQFEMSAIRSELRQKLRSQQERRRGSQQGPGEAGAEEEEEDESISRQASTSSQRSILSEGSSMINDYAGVPAHQVLAYEELTFGQVIGEGSFGIVRAAEWRGMLVAVKELRASEKLLLGSASAAVLDVGIPRTGVDGKTTRENPEEWELKHEAAMMSRVSNHENIVPFVGVLLEPKPCVVTKLMRRGSVEDMLVVPGPLYQRHRISRGQILKMLVDAAAGVLHLHSEGVIHRDIAARNLLVDENLRVKVADFGFARIKEMNRSKGYTSSSVGPIKWMAPEAMRFRTFSELSDVFSFGVTIYEVATGRRPWEGVESMDVVYRICRGERLRVLPTESGSETLCELVDNCQQHEQEQRPSMKEVHKCLVALLKDLNDGSDDELGGPRLRRVQSTGSYQQLPSASGPPAPPRPPQERSPGPAAGPSAPPGAATKSPPANDYVDFR